MKNIKNKILAFLMIAILLPLNADASTCGNYNCSHWRGSVASAEFEEGIRVIPDVAVCSGGALLCFKGTGDTNSLGGSGLYLKIIRYEDDKSETIVGTPILLYTGNFLSSVTSVVDNGANAVVSDFREDIDGSECLKTFDIKFDGAKVVNFYKENIKYYVDDSGSTKAVTRIYDESLPANDGLANYIRTTLIGKYFKDPATIKSQFKLTDAEYTKFFEDMDKYYIAFEPAYRAAASNDVSAMAETGTTEWKHSPDGDGRKRREHTFYCASQNKTETSYSSTLPTSGCDIDCDSSGNNCKNGWTLSSSRCTSYENQYNQILIVHNYSATSYVKPARYTSALKLISAIVTPKTDEDCDNSNENEYSNCVKQPVWVEDPKTGQNVHAEQNGQKLYEYYIGPTLKTAMVGDSANNKYKLFDLSITLNSGNLSTYKSQNYAIGVSYWWMPNIVSCNKTCGHITDKTGDTLLACAEQFCDNAIGYDDRANTQSQKACCMTSQCGYQFTPVSCSTKNPYKDIDVSDTLEEINGQTTCSVLNVDNTKSKDNIRTIVTCYGDTEPQKKEDGSLDFSNINYDEKSYINIACKESSSFEYADLSTKRIIAGEGLNYFANLYGAKECTIYFDLPSWKFAYASYHSQDEVFIDDSDGDGLNDSNPVNVRKQLIDILNYYNKCAIGDKSDPICNIGGDTIGIDIEGNAVSLSWENLNYDINKVKVNTQVTEIINNKTVPSDSYTLVIGGDKKDTSKTINGTDKINEIKYSGKTLLSSYVVNRYITSNTVDASYMFEKYCVTTDGKATVYKAPENGICEAVGEGQNVTEILGKNVYYTSLEATPNSEITSEETHAVKNTTTTIYKEGTNGDTYLEETEYCPYEIESGGISCSIQLTTNAGTTGHGYNIYDGPITAELIIHDQLGIDDSIAGIGLSLDNSQELNGKKELVVNMSNSNDGIDIKNIYGVVKTKNGKQVTCDAEVKIVLPCEKIGVSCEVNKIDDSNNLYEIETTASKVYYALSSNIRKIKNINTHPEKYGFKEVYKTLHNGAQKYLVSVPNRNKNSVLYGLVKQNGRYCACWDELQDLPNCNEDCNRSDVGEVKKHCEKNWSTDINDYENYDDCVTKCKLTPNCDSYKASGYCSVTLIEKDCNDNYNDWNFNDKSSCINYIYNDCNCAGLDYIYRPVNNYNPFPNSYDSNTLGFNYPTGDRIIGGNWVGKTEYIKADDKDESSVTGVQAGQKVEYVIDLTPDDIRRIRENTAAYNKQSEGKNAYLDYIDLDEGSLNSCSTPGYCSEFIYGGEFNDIFTVKPE